MHGEGAIPWRELLWFVGWVAALVVLLLVGLRLPLQTRFRRFGALVYNGAIVLGALAVAALANIALARHEAHLDLTRERTFTPSLEADAVAGSLTRDVQLTYFYHAADQNGRRAKSLVRFSAAATRVFTCAPSIPTSSRSWPRRTAFACTMPPSWRPTAAASR